MRTNWWKKMEHTGSVDGKMSCGCSAGCCLHTKGGEEHQHKRNKKYRPHEKKKKRWKWNKKKGERELKEIPWWVDDKL